MAGFTRDLKWNVTNAKYYVHDQFGDDDFGDGTQQKPWKSINKAIRAGNSGTICCVGYFSEDWERLDSNKSTYGYNRTIIGDYWGAAVFDGRGAYALWGFSTTNVILVNCLGKRRSTNALDGFVGVGVSNDADFASNANYANYVYGVSGSSVLIHNSHLHWGAIMSNSSDPRYMVFSKIKANKTNVNGYVYVGGSSYCSYNSHFTIYDIAAQERRKSIYAGGLTNSILAKFSVIINEGMSVAYRHCLFTSDCEYYYFKGASAANGYIKICDGTDITSAEDIATKLAEYNTEHETSYAMTNVSFTECVFSQQSSDEIFNDAENLDFTIKEDSDANTGTPWGASSILYIGAMPPAEKVVWDERTKTGCIEIVNGNVMYNKQSPSDRGSLRSEVITLDPSKRQVNGLFGYHIPLFRTHRVITCDPVVFSSDPIKATIIEGDTAKSVKLPIGTYIAKGIIPLRDLSENEINVYNGQTFFISSADTYHYVITDGQQDTNYVVPIIEPNIRDCVYVRCRSTIYKVARVGDVLKHNCTYVNFGNKDIIYRERTISSGKSFIADSEGEQFTCSDPNYKIGCLFDDSGDEEPLVPSADWVPARTFGEYFVAKDENGAILSHQYTAEQGGGSVPIGSGYANAYRPDDGETVSLKSVANQPYVQFRVVINKCDF